MGKASAYRGKAINKASQLFIAIMSLYFSSSEFRQICIAWKTWCKSPMVSLTVFIIAFVAPLEILGLPFTITIFILHPFFTGKRLCFV